MNDRVSRFKNCLQTVDYLSPQLQICDGAKLTIAFCCWLPVELTTDYAAITLYRCLNCRTLSTHELPIMCSGHGSLYAQCRDPVGCPDMAGRNGLVGCKHQANHAITKNVSYCTFTNNRCENCNKTLSPEDSQKLANAGITLSCRCHERFIDLWDLTKHLYSTSMRK